MKSDFLQWEEELLVAIEKRGLARSDAQKIVDAHKFATKMAWLTGLDPHAAATKVWEAAGAARPPMNGKPGAV